MGTLPQAQMDGFTNLKRMAFIYAGNTVTLRINPQNYQMQSPQRATTIKTQGDNVNEQYGPDFPIITMSGTTGWHRDSGGLTGAQRFEELRWLISSYQSASLNGSTPPSPMYFYNYTDGYSYTVAIASGGFEYTRSVEKPILFDYSLTLICLSGADEPDRANIQQPNLIGGNSGTGTSISQGLNQTIEDYARAITDEHSSASSKNTAIQYMEDALAIAKKQKLVGSK